MILVPLFYSIFFCLTSGAPTSDKPYPNPNPTNGTCAYDGLTMGDPYDVKAYYQCCQNMWFFKYCFDGEIFDKSILICVPNSEKAASPQICHPGDRHENTFETSEFFNCIDGTHWETKSCSMDTRFDPITKQCSSASKI